MTAADADYAPDAKGPLDGVRILDLSRLVAGNMLTHLLADWGADVIKVERPGKGDDLRNWRVNGVSTHWKVYGRNKRSIALDLRSEAGREVLLRLAEGAQALVENYVPGTLEKWGLGPEVLHARNPGLVIVRVSGWGQTGDYREKPGFGTLVEAMSGFAALNGFPDGPPVLPPLAFADMIAGAYGAGALLTALRHVEVAGGGGQVIDLSLFEPIFSFLSSEAVQIQVSGRGTQRSGNRSTITAPRNLYQCGDGEYVALSGSMQSMAERLFHAIGRPELIDDPRFLDNDARLANVEELDAIVGGFMAERTRDEALQILQAAGVTAGPVCDMAELMSHPYVASRGALTRLPDAETGVLPMHAPTPRFSGTPGAIRRAAPAVGEHSAELLAEAGYTAEEIEAMRAGSVI